MKFQFIVLSVIGILLSACTSETKKDAQIDPKIKQEVRIVNTQIVDALIRTKPSEIFPLCNEHLKLRKKELINLAHLFKGTIRKSDFKILNEYYQKNEGKKRKATVSTGSTTAHGYQLNYQSINKEMYVIVGFFQDSVYQKCFTFIYGKQGDNWKLNNLEVGVHKIMNMDAIDWYLQAKSEYQKGYLMDAMCHIELSTQLLKPANKIWKYKNEKEILDFEQKINQQTYAKFKFPITINNIPTKPVIKRIYSYVMEQKCLPLIVYSTSVGIEDVSKLAMECKAIHKSVEKLFNGIATNNIMIVYRPVQKSVTESVNENRKVFMMETMSNK